MLPKIRWEVGEKSNITDLQLHSNQVTTVYVKSLSDFLCNQFILNNLVSYVHVNVLTVLCARQDSRLDTLAVPALVARWKEAHCCVVTVGRVGM